MTDRKLKVFGTRMHKRGMQYRAIMATTRQQDIIDATGSTRPFVSRTSNAAEVEAAHARPGVLLVRREYTDHEFEPWPIEDYHWRWHEKRGKPRP